MRAFDANNGLLAQVRRLIRQSESLELSAGAMQRLKWFLYCLEHDGNVSLTCRHFGIARSTFLRWALRFDPKDIDTLEEQSRRPKSVRPPETDERIVALIGELRRMHPTMGKVPLTQLLRTTYNIDISESTVGRVIARNRLFFAETQSHISKRSNEVGEERTQTSTQTTRTDEAADDSFPFSVEPGLTS